MGAINKELRDKLVFERKEIIPDDHCHYEQILISTTYDGIYRECLYVNYHTDIKGNPQDPAQLEEEIKNIVTYAIEYELNKRNNDNTGKSS